MTVRILPWMTPMSWSCKAGESFANNLIDLVADIQKELKDKYVSTRIEYDWCSEDQGHGPREITGLKLMASNGYAGIPGLVEWTDYFPLFTIGNKAEGMPFQQKDDLSYQVYGQTNQESIQKILAQYNLN